MAVTSKEAAFPTLDASEMEFIRSIARAQEFQSGQPIMKAGDPDIDFIVVDDGAIEILNPIDNNRLVAIHKAGEFVGDIDLLTRRPIIVTALAKGTTRILRIPGDKLRELLNTVPRLSEKLLTAFMQRREMLQQTTAVGLRVTGPGSCKDTNAVREFLYKNFVPFVWYDSDGEDGKKRLTALGSPKKSPVIECADGTVLINPSLQKIAECAGMWHGCPEENESFDLAVVGAGPAGMTAAVYAASEGLKTIVLDRLGPGGQAGGSSKIENFIGFPSGLSGTELATRGVLQMLKFGAKIITPVNVQKLIPAAKADDCHVLELDCGAKVRAHTVLVATGACWRQLAAKGAARYDRAGIYYACTTVEGYMYDGKDVAVVGAGNSAGQAAMFLAERCARAVHMLIRGPELGPGMSEYLAQRIRATPNIKVHVNTEIAEVHGAARIERLTLSHRDGTPNSELGAEAVFVFIGAEPEARWLPDTVARDDLGYLLTGHDARESGHWPLNDREPCQLETSIPRIIAAGDVRSGSTKRVGFAVGDGALAVTCTHRLRSAIAAPKRAAPPPPPASPAKKLEPAPETRKQPALAAT
ncbi:MAG TPA: FAD-dependent oxidoreductase [Phycisphaerae bacterium]|nr:FAD-dependent oxidoreductase [Phycisphaerae bacterium]